MKNPALTITAVIGSAFAAAAAWLNLAGVEVAALVYPIALVVVAWVGLVVAKINEVRAEHNL